MFSRNRSIKRTPVLAAAAALLAFPALMAACGNGNPSTSSIRNALSGNAPPASSAWGTCSAIPTGAPIDALVGTYSGTIYSNVSGTTLSQPYTFAISKVSQNGQLVAMGNFASSGVIGELGFQSCLSLYAVPYMGTDTYVSIMTAIAQIPYLSSVPFSFNFEIGLSSGTRFDSVQSRPYVMDCSNSPTSGFSSLCGSLAPDAWFDAGLAKL